MSPPKRNPTREDVGSYPHLRPSRYSSRADAATAVLSSKPHLHYAGAEGCDFSKGVGAESLTASPDEVTCGKCRLFLGLV